MNKPIAIIAGEPNSISSEIIFKTWKLRKTFRYKPFFIVGSFDLLNFQKKKLKYSIKLKKIDEKFKIGDLKGKELPILNINYTQKKAFEKISSKSSNYIFECFNETLKLIKKKSIIGFINCPVAKESLFKKKYQGVTEFLSKKSREYGNEVMLLYNEKLSVSPITTHVSINQISKMLKKKIIINKVLTIDDFYKRILKKKPRFVILGLNPHNYSTSKASEENKIIVKAAQYLKKLKLNIQGPIAPDSSFMNDNRSEVDVIVGMYHDQVLTPFKALYNYKAINITLGLPYVRISPDHGTAANIVGKKIAKPISLIESIKFFNNIK